jgi:hypothetical protein
MARKETWDRPDEGGKIKKRQTSVGPGLGKSHWEQPLPDWIMVIRVGMLCYDLRDNEAERVEWNDGWRRVPLAIL